jgi:hypothetical protein
MAAVVRSVLMRRLAAEWTIPLETVLRPDSVQASGGILSLRLPS